MSELGPVVVTGPDDPAAAPAPGDDLVAFRSPRRSLWGLGVALRIELPAPWTDHVGVVGRALADLAGGAPNDAEPGTGPVAFGALPYDRNAPATFIVPAVLHGRSPDGRRWRTRIGDTDRPTAAARGGSGPEAPRQVRVRSARDPDDWCDDVRTATKRIAEGDLTKVVLARELIVDADAPFDPASVHLRLVEAAPHAYCFCVDGFVGASPELLVSRIGEVVRAQPMAGTAPRSGDEDRDRRAAAELAASAKNRVEHQITIDAVHEAVLPWCSYLDAEPEPSVVAAGPVQHLATTVEGRLSRPLPSVLDLVGALHPTPAVGGWPREPALDLQRQLEQTDRGRYAGPVGWVDAAGNGAFAVGIRSVELHGNRGRVFAGVGVVADSDPLAELDETRAKSQAVLSVLSRT
ncbi:MAG: isochorismate synthase [Acidobacteria bacterium]|nr:isochorismate synthase [Acidobacteriota bacterium]